MEGDSRYSVHFVKLVRRGDLSGVISDAELAAMAVQFLRAIDVSKGTSDADFAAMMRWAGNVVLAYTFSPGATDASDVQGKSPLLERDAMEGYGQSGQIVEMGEVEHG